MLTNAAIQNLPLLLWDGTTAYPRDTLKWTNFAFAFEVATQPAADAVFEFEAAPPSANDPCVPGTFAAIDDIEVCDAPIDASGKARVTIPAGTVVGTVCTGTIRCRGNQFIRVRSVSGDTDDIRAAIVLQGPQI